MRLNSLEFASPHNTGSPDLPSSGRNQVYTSAILEDHPEYPGAGGLRQHEQGIFSKLSKTQPGTVKLLANGELHVAPINKTHFQARLCVGFKDCAVYHDHVENVPLEGKSDTAKIPSYPRGSPSKNSTH